jgi:hypothetical protein
MSRETLRPRLEEAEKFFLTSSPAVGVKIRDFFPFLQIHLVGVTTPIDF